jgi:hypothetical protein
MPRPLRPVILTAALTLGALVATALPASAQQTPGLFQSAEDRAEAANFVSPNFLTAGFTAAAAQARSQNQQGFGFGIKGGFLFSSAKSAQLDFSSKGGTAIGIFFGGNRTGAVGVMGEILLAQRKLAEKGSDDDDVVKVNYIEIPILARVNIGSSSVNGLSFYGLLGPVFDIKLKAKQGDFDFDDNYQSFDIGVIAGGGVEFLRFIAEARYNWGLRNVAGGDLADTTKVKTRTFMVLFGFRIN